MTDRWAELARRYRELGERTPPQRRGRELEPLIAELFKQGAFDVRANPKTARPRQTDLVAVRDRDLYLVEVKWTKGPIGVGEVDSLLSRLRRTDRSAVGVLVSVSGLTRPAIELIAAERARPILVVDGEELGGLMYAPSRLPHVLRRKQRELFFNARVAVGDESLTGPAPFPGELPESGTRVVRTDGSSETVVTTQGGFEYCLFSTRMTDVDWVPTPGAGVVADIPLSLRSGSRVADLLKGMAALGWVTKPHWAIQQAGTSWFGFGARELVRAIDDHDARHQSLASVHHREEVLFSDHFEGGFYTLTLDLSSDRHRVVTRTNISLHLEGIPLDPQPLNQLLEFCGAERPVYFRSMTESAVEKHFFAPADRVDVSPVGFIVEPDRTGISDADELEWVVGVVVENPFWQDHAASAGDSPEWLPMEARNQRHIACALDHHHPLGTSRARYELWGYKWARTTDLLVVRPMVSWL